MIYHLLALAAFLPLSCATVLDVWDPEVEIPGLFDVWDAGATKLMVWNTANAPIEITNTTGTAYLGYPNGSLILPPIAKGFSLLDGETNVTIPINTPGGVYRAVLVGDSGNAGELFQVRGKPPSDR